MGGLTSPFLRQVLKRERKEKEVRPKTRNLQSHWELSRGVIVRIETKSLILVPDLEIERDRPGK